MKRINKYKDSKILTKKMQYPADRTKIREVLQTEQGGYCAYTEARIPASFSIDIEHFNPELKETKEDGYQNWFAVSHKWNLKKGNAVRWRKYQPILYPTAEDFEKRIVYDTRTASYIHEKQDIKAKNLIDFLDINNENLIKDRADKIKLLEDLFKETDKENFLEWLSTPKSKQDLVEFRRAIETVFNIEL